MHRTTRRLLAASGLTFAIFVGATGLTAVRDGHATDWPPPTDAQSRVAQSTAATRVERSDGDPEGLSRAFRAAAQRALPAVVYVQVEHRPQAAPTRGYRGSPSAPRQGSGSGFIFRPDGYIVTNNHVIDGAERVSVVLQDRREFSAEVIGRDPNTDVAVIRIEAKDLPVVPIGDSDGIDVGDWVVALGYPLSLGSTATAGIVSAKGRTLNILRQNAEAAAPLEHFIQTDAAINPGNSGGPLVNLEGHAVGINSAIASPTGFFNGYGFAVPINIARRVAEDLIRYGEPHRPRLGVSVQDVEPVDAEIYKLTSVAGAEIIQITPNLPAERAGLKIGDVVTAVEGKAVVSGGDLTEMLAQFQPGQRVNLDVVRYGRKLSIAVELGEFEPAARAGTTPRPAPRAGVARLGFAAAQITPDLARMYELRAQAGVIVTDIDPGSGLMRAGLQPYMLIERLNDQQIQNLDDLERAVRDLKAGSAVSLVGRDREGVQTIINFRVRG